jgi:hypothetical protein
MGSIEQRTLQLGWVVPIILAACATAGSGATGDAPPVGVSSPHDAGAASSMSSGDDSSSGGSSGGSGSGGGSPSSGDDSGGSQGGDDATTAGDDASASDDGGSCAATCAGCCDVNGTCNDGTEDSVCGLQGVDCVDCVVASETCQSGSCATGSGSSGGSPSGSASGSSSGSSGGTSGSCTLLNCLTGCCQGNTCITKTSTTACGNLGNACKDCSATGQTCNLGMCSGRARVDAGKP